MKQNPKSARPVLTQLEGREVPAAMIGGLDTSFALTGKTNFTIAAGTNQANAVVVQNDGKILLGGTTDATNAPNADFFVTRHNTDGSFDTTFGNGGKVIFGQASKEDVVTSLAVLNDGSIIGAGYTNRGGLYDFAVFKLNPNGGIDPSFAGTGTKTFNILNDDKAYAMQVVNNKIIIAGASDIDGAGAVDKDDISIARLNLDGTFDTTFNGGAAKRFNLGKQEQARSLAVASDGSIILAGYIQDPSTANSSDFVVIRVQADGSGVSPTFGTTTLSGTKATTVDFAAFDDKAYSAFLQSDNNIVIGGSALIPSDTDFAVIRLNGTDGTLDTNFATTGKLTVDMGGNDVATNAMVDVRGRIILSGYAFKGESFDFAIASVEADGSALTSSFGTAGKSFYNIISEDKAFAATADNTGRIILAGRSLGNVAVTRTIARLNEPLALLVGGSNDGRATEFFPASSLGYGTPGTVAQMFTPFDKLVRTAIGDVNGDGVEDRIAVAGPGGPSSFTVRSGIDNAVIVTSFNVFESAFTGGLYVESADLNNDGFADVIITPDQSGGPIVAIYDGAKLAAGLSGDAAQIVRFFGIADDNFRGGARAAAGDIDGDGFADVLIAAGFGGGPRVAIFNGKSILSRITDIGTLGGKPDQSFRLRPDFFVFEDTLRNGAFATIGDLDGDGQGDLIVGGGPGGGPRVRAVSGKALLGLGSLTSLDLVPTTGLQLNNFFAGSADTRGGVRLTTRDLDGDNLADLVAASGDNQASSILVFRGSKLLNNATPVADQTIDPYASQVLTNGVFVG